MIDIQNLQRNIILYSSSLKEQFFFLIYCLIMIHICHKFHENIVYGLKF